MDPVRQVLQLYLSLTPEQLIQFHELLRVLEQPPAQQAAVQSLSQARAQSPIQPSAQIHAQTATQQQSAQVQGRVDQQQDVVMNGDGQSPVEPGSAIPNSTLEAHTLPQEGNSAPKIKSEPGSASSLAHILKQAQPTPASIHAFSSSSNAAPRTKRPFSAFEADNNKQNGVAESQPPSKQSRPTTGFGAASTYPPPALNKADDNSTPASPDLFMVDTVGSSDARAEDHKSAGFHPRMTMHDRAPGVSRHEHSRRMLQEKKREQKANSAEVSEKKSNFAFTPDTSIGDSAFASSTSAQASSIAPPPAPKNGFQVNAPEKKTPLFNFVGPNAGTSGLQQTTQQPAPFDWQLTNAFTPKPTPTPASSPFQPSSRMTPSAFDPTRPFLGPHDATFGALFKVQAQPPSSDQRPARGVFRGQRGRGQGNRGDRGGRGGPGPGARRGN